MKGGEIMLEELKEELFSESTVKEIVCQFECRLCCGSNGGGKARYEEQGEEE